MNKHKRLCLTCLEMETLIIKNKCPKNKFKEIKLFNNTKFKTNRLKLKTQSFQIIIIITSNHPQKRQEVLKKIKMCKSYPIKSVLVKRKIQNNPVLVKKKISSNQRKLMNLLTKFQMIKLLILILLKYLILLKI